MRLAVAAALAAIVIAPAPVASATAQSTHAAHSAEDFATLPGMSGAKLSPNGQRVATKVAIKGDTYLMILSLNGAKPSLVPSPEGDINWWKWVNDDWLVVGVGDRLQIHAIDEGYVTRALGVSADGKTVIPLLRQIHDLAQNADELIWTAHDGSPRILLSAQRSVLVDEAKFWPEVYEVDVSTGKYSVAVPARQGVYDWIADGSGMVRMGVRVTTSGEQEKILYRGPEGGRFHEFPGKDSSGQPAPYPSVILADGRAFTIADDQYGFSVLYEYDLKRMALGKAVEKSNGYDLGGYQVDDARTKLLGVYLDEERSTIRWTDPSMKALQAEINALAQGVNASIISTSRNQDRAIVLFSTPETPGAYFLYDRPTKKLTRMAYVNSAIKMETLNPVSMIRYKARDGLSIDAVLTLPKSGPKTNLPLIVMPHGGPFARDSLSWDWWTQFLADRGYAVVQPNYRGSSGYGTGFTAKGEGEWGLKMQDDLVDAISHLAKQGTIDPKRVCIVGASYGGYAAMRATQRDADHYRCAISYAGVSDLKRLSRSSYGQLFGAKSKAWIKRQAPDLSSVSPINTPQASKIPLLLVHGRKDRRVDVSHSRDLAKALTRAQRDVTYIEQPEADHFFSREADRLEFLKAMEAFLARHNPA